MLSADHKAQLWDILHTALQATEGRAPPEELRAKMRGFLRATGEPEESAEGLDRTVLLREGAEVLYAEVRAVAAAPPEDREAYAAWLTEFAARARLLVAQGLPPEDVRKTIRLLAKQVEARPSLGYIQGISREDDAPWRALIAQARTIRELRHLAVGGRQGLGAPLLSGNLKGYTDKSFPLLRAACPTPASFGLWGAPISGYVWDALTALDLKATFYVALPDLLNTLRRGRLRAVLLLGYASSTEWELLREALWEYTGPVVYAFESDSERLVSALECLEEKLRTA